MSPPMVITTGTAALFDEPAGTSGFTWYSPTDLQRYSAVASRSFQRVATKVSPLNGQKRVRLRRTAADLNRDRVVTIWDIRNHYVELILSGADNAGKLVVAAIPPIRTVT